LMRATPLAVYLSKLPANKAKLEMVAHDVMMTHTNPIVIWAVFIYNETIGHLLQNKDSKNRAGDAIKLASDLAT